MDTIKQLTITLDDLQISHGQLRLFAQQHNMSYTDDQQVFCKVSRAGFSTRELKLELQLAAHYGSTLMLLPLSSEPVMFDDSIMTVWAWEPMTNLWSDTATAHECGLAAELLMALHALPVPNDLPVLTQLTDFSFLLRKLDQRVAFAAQHGLGKNDTGMLYTFYEAILKKVIFPDMSRFVLNHGDPHFGNLVRRGNAQQLCYIDYESAQLAYREFDIAAIRVNLGMLGQNHDGWRKAYERFATQPISQADLEIFTIARLISMTAYGLLHPDAYDAFKARMRLLNNYYTAGILPTEFPRLD